MIKTNIHRRKGFTLIETLIAISILVLAVTGAFAAAHNGVTSAIFSRDQVTAFYLAQEGIEQIRNMRDRNGLQSPGVNWLTNIATLSTDPCYFGGGARSCRVDIVNNTIVSCGAPGNCPVLKFDSSNGFYNYVTGVNTKFKREIQLTQISANEVAIDSSVTWSKGLINRTFTAHEIIFNWNGL